MGRDLSTAGICSQRVQWGVGGSRWQATRRGLIPPQGDGGSCQASWHDACSVWGEPHPRPAHHSSQSPQSPGLRPGLFAPGPSPFGAHLDAKGHLGHQRSLTSSVPWGIFARRQEGWVLARGARPAFVERSVCAEAQKQPGCRGPRHAEDDGWSTRVTTGPAGRGCHRGPLSFPDKVVNLTTTPTHLLSEGNWFLCITIIPAELGEARVFHMPGGRGPGDPPAPTSAPGHPTLEWSREAALSLNRQGACRRREPGVSGERTRDQPAGPRLRPEIQICVRMSPRLARLRTWSTNCVVRTVASSQDRVSTAAVLENVLTKALLRNPIGPSTQPSAGYRYTGVGHSPGPLWVPKSLPS